MSLESHPENRVADFVDRLAKHQLGLFRYIHAFVGSVEDAEDLLQETCRVLWERFDEFEPGSNFNAWTRKVAWYCILENRRANQRAPHILPADVLEMLHVEAESFAPGFKNWTCPRCPPRFRWGSDRDMVESLLAVRTGSPPGLPVAPRIGQGKGKINSATPPPADIISGTIGLAQGDIVGASLSFGAAFVDFAFLGKYYDEGYEGFTLWRRLRGLRINIGGEGETAAQGFVDVTTNPTFRIGEFVTRLLSTDLPAESVSRIFMRNIAPTTANRIADEIVRLSRPGARIEIISVGSARKVMLDTFSSSKTLKVVSEETYRLTRTEAADMARRMSRDAAPDAIEEAAKGLFDMGQQGEYVKLTLQVQGKHSVDVLLLPIGSALSAAAGVNEHVR